MHHHLLPQRSSQRRPPQGRFSMQLHILPCLFWVMMISSWLSKGVVNGNSLPLLLSNRGGGGSNNNNDSVDKGSSNKGSTPFGVVGKTAQSARNIIRRRRLQQGSNVNHKDDKDEKEKSTITVAEKEGQDDTATSKGSNNNNDNRHNDHQDANSDNTQLTTSNTSSNSIPQQPSIRLKPRIVSLNVMIAGLSGLGKTTTCASLLDAWQQQQPKQQQQQPQERYTSKVQSSNRSRSTSSISPKTLHVDPSRQYKRFDAQENTWVHVRIIDTPGFGNRIDHRDAVRPILKYIHKCRRQHYRYFTAANRGGEFLYTYLLLDVVPVVDGGGKADYIRSGDAEPQTLVELSFDVMSNAISNAQFKEIKWAATLSLSLLHMQNRKAAQQ